MRGVLDAFAARGARLGVLVAGLAALTQVVLDAACLMRLQPSKAVRCFSDG